MKRDCPCGTPTRDRFLCYGCGHRLEGYLTDLHDLNGELHTALTRMVRMSERSDGGKSAETALVFNQTAAERIRLNRATMVAWVRIVAADTGTPSPVNTSTRILVDWLADVLPEIIAHREDAPAFLDEIRDCRDQSQRIVDLPVNRSTFEAGKCPEVGEAGPCDGKVWAVFPRDLERRPRVECRTCRTVWYGEQWTTLAKKMGRKLPINPDAARALMGRIA